MVGDGGSALSRPEFWAKYVARKGKGFMPNKNEIPPLFSHTLDSFGLKDMLANAGDLRDTGSISRLGRYTGGGHDNPLQYSCLENPMDRGV